MFREFPIEPGEPAEFGGVAGWFAVRVASPGSQLVSRHPGWTSLPAEDLIPAPLGITRGLLPVEIALLGVALFLSYRAQGAAVIAPEPLECRDLVGGVLQRVSPLQL